MPARSLDLEATHEEQNNQDQQQKPDDAASTCERSVTSAITVTTARQGNYEYDDKDQDERAHEVTRFEIVNAVKNRTVKFHLDYRR